MKVIRTILMAGIVGFAFQSSAQSATSSGGGKMENDEVKVTVTVGEPTIGIASDSSQTEMGFQQVYEAKDVSVAETKSKLKLNLFPNPTANRVSISNKTKLTLVYTLYTMQGQVVSSVSSDKSKVTIDLSHQAKGMYMLKCLATGDQQMKAFKITKK